ncbi:MAG TPA: sulfite exporter TauE/SafE family protein [Acetobacteraceae bacterium]|nr:sulfite exporter TauE/SafE family protein [Acetobacteraceae bacterium]
MHSLSAPLLFAAFSFLLAGSAKGVAGMGLPTVAMGLLGLQMPPAEAASLIVFPSLATNLWQYLGGPHRLGLLRRLWPMLLAICAATWAGAGLLVNGVARDATLALGGALLAYGLFGLARLRLAVRPNHERWLSPAAGLATGVITGATGVFVLPAVPYLQALDLKKDVLVQALGLSFTVSTLSLAAGLATRGALQVTAAGESLACILPALAGMALGQRLRNRIAQASFRRVFFLALLALGAALVAR